MTRKRMLLAAAAVLLATLGSALWAGSRRHQRALAAQVETLTRAAAEAAPLQPSIESRDSLPAPVARYLRWALPEAPSMPLVRMAQRGTLRTDAETERWMPFDGDSPASSWAPLHHQ